MLNSTSFLLLFHGHWQCEVSRGQLLNKKGNTVLVLPVSDKDQKMDLYATGEGFLEVTA